MMKIDLQETAARIGAVYEGNRLIVKIMGKQVAVDSSGKVATEIHTTPRVMVPLFHYILACKGTPVEGRWVPLRELPNGRDWCRLFGQAC